MKFNLEIVVASFLFTMAILAFLQQDWSGTIIQCALYIFYDGIRSDA